MSGLYRRRRAPYRRSYKRKRAYSRRRPLIYKRRSYKRRRSYVRGYPRRALRTRSTHRFVNVSRDVRRDKGFFKLSAYSAVDRISFNCTVHTPYMASLNCPQNSTNVTSLNLLCPTTFPPIVGLMTDVYNKYGYTRVVCSRLTVTIQREDGLDISPWEFALTPLNRYQYSQGVTTGAHTNTPTWAPTGVAATVDARWASLKQQRGTRSKRIGSATSGVGPLTLRLSSTVMQAANYYLSSDPTDNGFNETSAASVSNTYRNYYLLSAFCQNPTATGTREFTMQFRYTWWVKAWLPRLTALVTAPTSSDPESKEEKSRGEVGLDSEDDDPSLDQFVDLRVVEAPKRPSMAPPSPAPAAGGSELRRTVSRAVVRP